MSITLEQVIRNNVTLSPRPNGRGFFSVVCKVCNDHARKGKRGGFKFEDEAVGYNCFNCGHSAAYDPVKHGSSMPKGMVQVLEAFNISQQEWEEVTFEAFMVSKKGSGTAKTEPTLSINPKELEYPAGLFYSLRDDKEDEWAQHAIDYLTDRHVKWNDYPFMLSKKTLHPIDKRWYGRLIIPVFKDGKLVFWQGRDLTDTMQKKYLSIDADRNKVLYGYDQILKHSDEPLYIMEGWFDAHAVNGVATFGNKLTPEQIKWINRSTRPKVYVPDKFGDGQIAALQAISEGWSVSIPDWGNEIKDINASINKYGELFTRMAIKRGTCSGFEAEVAIGLYCSNS